MGDEAYDSDMATSYERQVEMADALHAALRRLDQARERDEIGAVEYRARFDVIGEWLQRRGVRFGREPDADLLTAWETRGRTS